MQIEIESLPEGSTPVTQTTQPASDGQAIQHLSIASRYNIDTPTKQEENQLQEIWDYATGLSKSKEISDIIWQVINLEGTVGTPRLGESRLDRLYRYCKLRRQEKMIQNELKGVVGV